MKKPTTKQWIVIAICLILMFLGQYFIPSFMGLSSQGVAVLCIFLGTMVLYCTVDILWPTVAAIVAVITNGLYTYSQAISLSFGNWIAIYCLFVTLMTYALRTSGFVRRAAIALVSNRLAQKGFKWFIAMYYLATLVVGCFIDPVTNYLVMAAILEEVFELIGVKKGDKLGRDLMIGLMIIDSISSGTTPIAHVNASMLTQMLNTDYNMPWSVLNFCAFGILTGLIFLVLYLVYLFVIVKPDLSRFAHLDIEKLRATVKPMQSRERSILVIYLCAVVLWIAPGILTYVWPAGAAVINKLGLIGPALIAILLFVLCHDKDGNPFLDFAEGLKVGVAWPVVILSAGTMLLGTTFNNADFGVVAAITNVLGPVFNGMSVWVVVLLACALAIIMTNFCSNTVTEVLIYGMTIPFMMSGVIQGANPMAFCAVIGFTVNVAFLTPTSCGSTAIFYAGGWCSGSDGFKKSLPIALISILFCAFVAYPIACLFL